MATRRRVRVRMKPRDWGIAALAVAAFGLAAWLYTREARREARPMALSLCAGSGDGRRHFLAEALAREARSRGLSIVVRDSAGSEESLTLVDRGEIDAALVQGGLNMERRANVRQVAALHVEPLHLLVKGDDLARRCASEGPVALRGKVINLGDDRTGTYWLARALLAFAGLSPGGTHRPGDYTIGTLTYAELEAEEGVKVMPEAVFLVSSLPSPTARRLVVDHGYRLVPLPYGEAFALGAFSEEEIDPTDEAVRDRTSLYEVRCEHVYDATVPAFTYDVEPGVPAETIHTLGTRLLVVAHKDVHPQAVARLLESIFSTRFAKVAHPPLESKLLQLPPEISRHPGAIDHLHRNQPLITGEAIDALNNSLGIAGAAVGGLYFLGQWFRRRARVLQDRTFEAYILKVAEIERRVMDLEQSSALDLKALMKLQHGLSTLKAEALAKFAEGDLEGEALMSGFLAHVNDVRSDLTRLILHQRDNLEERARAEGRPAEALWQEAVAEAGRDSVADAVTSEPPGPAAPHHKFHAPEATT